MVRLNSRASCLLAAGTVLLGASVAFAVPREPYYALNSFNCICRPNIAQAVYTLSNEADGNRLIWALRDNDGELGPKGYVATGGLGSGDSLGNQGALILSGNRRHLYAVNPGSNTITVIGLHTHGPKILETHSSGGTRPISLATNGDFLYVLNAGGASGGMDTISGFTVGDNGRLTPLPNSTKPLSAANTSPAQIGFDPSGDVLVVTEKATNKITTFVLDANGLPGDAIPQNAAGQTPFGFASVGGYLVVSEAEGGAPNASAVSTYTVAPNGTITVVEDSELTTETAACWIAATRNGKYVYTTNTGSDSVTGFRLDKDDGNLRHITQGGKTGILRPGNGPTDASVYMNQFLYTLNPGTGTIALFRINANGTLVNQLNGGATDIPTTATGLVAH